MWACPFHPPVQLYFIIRNVERALNFNISRIKIWNYNHSLNVSTAERTIWSIKQCLLKARAAHPSIQMISSVFISKNVCWHTADEALTKHMINTSVSQQIWLLFKTCYFTYLYESFRPDSCEAAHDPVFSVSQSGNHLLNQCNSCQPT